MNKTLAITGGAGFVGTNLALHALAKGYNLAVYDTRDRLRRLQLSGLLQHDLVTLHATNLVQDSFQFEDNVQAIIHLAAFAHVDYSLYQPARTITNNVLSLVKVLQIAIARNIPVLFISSVEVYGGNDGEVFSEDSALHPLSPYASSKVSCEAILKSYVTSFGLTATTVRLTNLYGPWQAPDRLIPRIITQILCNHPCEAEKDRFRDYVYITDATEALLGIIDKALWGETFNLSSGLGFSNPEVVAKLEGVTNEPFRVTIINRRPRDGRGKSLVSLSEKLQTALDWKPSIDLEKGISLAYNWYCTHCEWWRQFEINIKSDRGNPEFIVDWTQGL